MSTSLRRKQVREKCAVQLARYDEEWPAQAVARVRLIEARAKMKKIEERELKRSKKASVSRSSRNERIYANEDDIIRAMRTNENARHAEKEHQQTKAPTKNPKTIAAKKTGTQGTESARKSKREGKSDGTPTTRQKKRTSTNHNARPGARTGANGNEQTSTQTTKINQQVKDHRHE